MNAVETTKLEPLVVQKENIIHLPLGLLGFERIKKYVLLSDPEEAPFHWLQVLEDPNLAFLVLSPFIVVPEYAPEISDDDSSFIGLNKPEDALIWNIVTLKPNGAATMNLRGPVVLNKFTLTGKQVVIANAAQYSLQYPLPIAGTTAS